MTNLSITQSLAPERPKLSDEEFAERRLGIAAAVQMFKTLAGMDAPTDDTYDATHAEHLQVLKSYVEALPNQSPAARDGFLFVLADNLYQAEHGGGAQRWQVHEGGPYHTNPPLTRTQMLHDEFCESEAAKRHRATGIALEPRERAALARRWLAARDRVKPVLPLATTEAEGRSRFIRLMAEAGYLNWNRNRPKSSENLVDAALQEAARWPEAARRGFTAMVSLHMVDEALGFSRGFEDGIDVFCTREDKAHIADVKRRVDEEADRIIARIDARKATTDGARA